MKNLPLSPTNLFGNMENTNDLMAFNRLFSNIKKAVTPDAPQDMMLRTPFFHPPVIEQPTTVSLGNRVWLDSNQNGRQDFNEKGIANVKVKLLDENGKVLLQTVTNSEGLYQFTQLKPGGYKVQFDAPTGYQFTKQNAGPDFMDSDADKAGLTPVYNLGYTHVDNSVDAGLIKTQAPQAASIGDRVWNDLNKNGVQDANEPGIAGVEVFLNRANVVYFAQGADQNIRKPDEVKVITDAKGNYKFDNVTPGEYSITFKKPAGYSFTKTDAGDDTRDSDAKKDGNTSIFRINAEQKITHIDAGLIKESAVNTAGVGDHVWLDSNGNGLQDKGEQGVAGVRVELCKYEHIYYTTSNQGQTISRDPGYTGIVVAKTVTDTSGKYHFADVPPTIVEEGDALSIIGEYYLQFHAPDGYSYTKPYIGNDRELDSDALAHGATRPFSIQAGEHKHYLDAGLVKSTSVPGPQGIAIGDRVWLDANGNGMQDQGDEAEHGVAGVTVELHRVTPMDYIEVGQSKAGSIDRLVQKITTDKNGNYLFENLKPSEMTDGGLTKYYLKFVAPDDHNFTKQYADPNKKLDSNVDQSGKTDLFVLKNGDQDFSFDAGLIKGTPAKTGSVGDRVWLDSNGNGIQDAGEQGVAGVLVKIYEDLPVYAHDANKSASSIIRVPYSASTTTDSSGQYKFNDVPAGRYFAEFIAPNGYSFTKQVAGNENNDSNPRSSGYTDGFAVEAGKHNASIDAGLIKTTKPVELTYITGKAWHDHEWFGKAGIQDADEQGFAGVTVKLFDAKGQLINSVLTGKEGQYLFDRVVPGQYRVEFEADARSYLTPKNVGNDDNIDSDVDPHTRSTELFTAMPGKKNDYDAGFSADDMVFPHAKVGNRVWNDLDGDGKQDANEPGLAGVTVHLINQGSKAVLTTTTDSKGNYQFDKVVDGQYKLHFDAPNAMAPTIQNVGMDTDDSDIDRSGMTALINLTQGKVDLTQDAGFVSFKPMPVIDDLLSNNLSLDSMLGGVNFTTKPLNIGFDNHAMEQLGNLQKLLGQMELMV